MFQFKEYAGGLVSRRWTGWRPAAGAELEERTVNQLRMLTAIEPLSVNHFAYAAVATCVANAASSSRAALGSADQPTVIAIA